MLAFARGRQSERGNSHPQLGPRNSVKAPVGGCPEVGRWECTLRSRQEFHTNYEIGMFHSALV